MDIHVDLNIFAKNLLREAVGPLSLGKEWLGSVATQRRIGFGAREQEHAIARRSGAERDQDGPCGRLVGGDEE